MDDKKDVMPDVNGAADSLAGEAGDIARALPIDADALKGASIPNDELELADSDTARIGYEGAEAVNVAAVPNDDAAMQEAEGLSSEVMGDNVETVSDEASIIESAEATPLVDAGTPEVPFSQVESASDAPLPMGVPAPSASDLQLPSAVPAPDDDPDEGEGIKIGAAIIIGVVALLLGLLLGLPSILATDPVAATVNGETVSEEEVTDYIKDIREQQNLTDDDSWGEWLVGTGNTAKQLRSDAIDYLVNLKLIDQAVDKNGITVEDSAVDEYITHFTEQVGGEEALNSMLEAQGVSKGELREDVRKMLEQQELLKMLAPESCEVDDAEVLAQMKQYFPDEVDEDATTLDGLDEEMVEQLRSMLVSSKQEQAFYALVQDWRSDAEITINDMPEGLPYDIELAPYEAAAESQDGAMDEDMEVLDLTEEAEDADGDGEGEVVVVDEGSSASSKSAQ